MYKKFILELIIGIILLAAVLIFGQKGMVVIVLLTIHPFIERQKKLDERESQLFNIIGNYTAAITLLASVATFYFSDLIINGRAIGDNWLFFVVAAFLISHGASALIIMRN